MTNEGGGIYSPSHWTNCPCGCGADENQKVGADETAKDGEVIAANKKPKGGGWHWPTYWQVKADEAKDVTPNVKVSGPEAASSPEGRARLPGSAAQVAEKG